MSNFTQSNDAPFNFFIQDTEVLKKEISTKSKDNYFLA